MRQKGDASKIQRIPPLIYFVEKIKLTFFYLATPSMITSTLLYFLNNFWVNF